MKDDLNHHQNVGIQNFECTLSNSYLGSSRYYCIQLLSMNKINCIAFGHWLAIPSQQLLLVFRHQQCVAIEKHQMAD